GRIMCGDLTGATAALERASAVGMPAGELAVFTAWLSQLLGQPTGARLPVASIKLIEVIFEALLRVGEFDALAGIYPLLSQTALDTREQRELMATVYLRRGFLAQAAQEWM